jgi:hypothetical protein
MTQDQSRRLRFAGASINLFGLILSVGTWAYRVWLRSQFPLPAQYTDFAWTLGGFCWVVGLLLFLGGWSLDRSPEPDSDRSSEH